MKTTKLLGYGLILLVFTYFVFPNLFTQINPLVSKHSVACEVNIGRWTGNPEIDSLNCFVGDRCSDLNPFTAVGDYKGKVMVSVGGVTKYEDYTVGLGLTSEAKTTVPVNLCVPDGYYVYDNDKPGIVKIYNGEGNAVLDSKSFSVVVE